MIFFTADTHFNHTNIIKYCSETRKHPSIEEMNNKIIQNWNNTVPQDSVVFHLGDFGFDDGPHRLKDIIAKLNGKIILIRGNHDENLRQSTLNAFDSVETYVEMEYKGINLVLFHYPIASWNGAYGGAIHLFGHSHNKVAPTVFGKGVSFDVGVDTNNMTPLSFKDICKRAMTIREKNK